MIINGKTSNSTVTDELLDIREKRWHKILPNAFKSFIKNHNGLIPDKRISIDDSIVVEQFLCILPSVQLEDGDNDIDVVLTKFDSFMVFSEDTIGYDLIPFAKLNRDRLLCLCYENEEPSVCVWSFEGSSDFKPNYSVRYNSFEAFLSKVCSE